MPEIHFGSKCVSVHFALFICYLTMGPKKVVPKMFGATLATLPVNKFLSCFEKWLSADVLETELGKAFKMVAEHAASQPANPLGKSSVARPPSEVKALAQTKGGVGSVLFGGSLQQLNLPAMAFDPIDTGRIGFILGDLTSVAAVATNLGTIVINSSLWPADTATDLIRASKDAEVAAVCLAYYMIVGKFVSVEDLAGTKTQLLEAFNDIPFDARAMGTGTQYKMNKFGMVQREEEERDVIGMSSARKCIFLTDLASDLEKEGSPGENDVDKLMNLFKQAKSTLGTWNADTMKRFLQVGRRLVADKDLRRLVQRWEYLEKRNALIDSITVLRTICGQAASNDELYTLMQTVFLEQRCKIRAQFQLSTRSKSLASPLHLVKALVLRRMWLQHLKHTFPKFRDLIEPFITGEAYETLFGVTISGQPIPDFVAPDIGGDDSDDDGCNLENLRKGSDASSYDSKGPILRFCQTLLSNKYEKTFVSMARDPSCNGTTELNLGVKAAISLVRTLNVLTGLYIKDFPPPSLEPAAEVGFVQHTDGKGEVVKVVLANAIETELEYKRRLHLWQESVASAETAAKSEYISGRLQWVVDSGEDPARLAKKIEVGFIHRAAPCNLPAC